MLTPTPTPARAARSLRRLRRCCCWLLLLVMFFPVATSSSRSFFHANASDWRQLQAPRRPRIATFRNAFGARFTCSPACYLVLLAHVVLLAAALALLLLVPVAPTHSEKAKRPSFLLWFGGGDAGDRKAVATATAADAAVGTVEVGGTDCDIAGKLVHSDAAASTRESPERGSWTRWPSFISSWWLWCETQYERATAGAASPSKGAERTGLFVRARVTSDVPKTYESIGVDTEDLLSSSSPGRRGSIFANAPQSPSPSPTKRRAMRARAAGGGTEALSVSFGASETSVFSELTIASRGDTTHGFSELLGASSPSALRAADAGAASGSPQGSRRALVVRDIERRASSQQRAEKRKERAKSDISYENLRDEEIQMYEYLEFVRELLEGMVVKKVCQKSAKVVKRTFFITKDMTTVYWNKLGTKGWSSKKSSLDTSRIDKVLKGFHGTANVETKGKSEKSALYVSVVCSDGKRLDLEAKDEAMRQRLYVGFSRLAAEKRHEQQQQQQTQEAASTATSTAPLHRLVVPEVSEEDKFPAPPPPAAAAPTREHHRAGLREDPETATEAAAVTGEEVDA